MSALSRRAMRKPMSYAYRSFVSPTLRCSSALLLTLLVGLGTGCSDDDPSSSSANGGASAGAGASAHSGGGSSGKAGAESGEAGTAGDDGEPAAGSGGAAGEAGAGAAGEAGNGASSAGGGSGSGPVMGDICQQVIAFLNGCGQTQGAGEAGQNCDATNPLSQCAVACLLEKECADVGNWPAPIEGCVDQCLAT